MEVPWPRADGASVVAKGAVEPGMFVDFVVGVDDIPVRGVLDVNLPRIDAYDGAYQCFSSPVSQARVLLPDQSVDGGASQPTISHGSWMKQRTSS